MNIVVRITFSLLLTLVVNGLFFTGLLYLKGGLPKKETTPHAVRSRVDFTPVKKQRTQRVKAKTVRRTAHTVRSLAPPNIPSSLAVKGVELMDLDSKNLVRPMFDAGLKASAELIMTEESVDAPPKAMKKNAPRYPERARDREIEGHVVVKFLVGRNGMVKRVLVEQASPKGMFEQTAVAAVKRWRFAPAKFEGKPVAVWVRQRLVFQLN